VLRGIMSSVRRSFAATPIEARIACSPLDWTTLFSGLANVKSLKRIVNDLCVLFTQLSQFYLVGKAIYQ